MGRILVVIVKAVSVAYEYRFYVKEAVTVCINMLAVTAPVCLDATITHRRC